MKKSYLVLVGVLLLLVITNPSQKAFKEYLGVSSYSGLRRTSNYFICSVYVSDDKYFAILGNFFEIYTDPFKNMQDTKLIRQIDRSMMDSAKMTDTSLPPPPPKKVLPYENSQSVDSAKMTDTTEVNKLHGFYYAILSNKNIKGLPNNYSDFAVMMANKEKAYFFYNSLSKNRHITGIPKTFDLFSKRLLLNPAEYRLWNALYSAGICKSDYGTFQSEYSTKKNVDKLFYEIHKSQYYTKSKEDFYKQYFNF